jgi:hypothetical protein
MWLLPSERVYLHAITLGLAPHSVDAMNISSHLTSIKQKKAIVVITGTLCSTGNFRTLVASDYGAMCHTNRDIASQDPMFRVTLVRNQLNQWQVDTGL